MTKFDDQLSVGHLNNEDLAIYLEEIGDFEGARVLQEAGARGQSLARMMGRKWAYTAHVFGFIEEGDAGTEPLAIVPAASIAADPDLVGSRIKVTLDVFRIAEYPGLGQHTVLFDFVGRDQAGDEAQDLQFASVLKVEDGDNAAISGMPIFTGLTVPDDGLSFQARTISIHASGDEAILSALQGTAFKDGLRLLGQVQPALPQLVGLAAGVTEALLKRRRNKQVQAFDLGLDFSQVRTSIRLRRGSYVVVQVPDPGVWDWSAWRYDPNSMNIVDADRRIAPLNTIVFAISPSESTTARSAARAEGRTASESARSQETPGTPAKRPAPARKPQT